MNMVYKYLLETQLSILGRYIYIYIYIYPKVELFDNIAILFNIFFKDTLVCFP